MSIIKLKELFNSNRQIGLHVTRKSNLSRIMKEGLIPHSPTLGQEQEDDNGIYFFPDRITLEDAWGAWLEDFFDENEEIVCLKVDITNLKQHVGGDYEIIVTEPVPPNRIIGWEKII